MLIPKREHPPTLKANEARRTRRLVARGTRKLVAVTLITEFKENLTQRFRKKKDTNRKEILKRLIQQSENHPNRDSLIEDLSKTEEFNPFSEKSKELITSMGNTEYFELCETSSKIQCLHCAQYWEAGIKNCTCGKCVQPSERNRQLNKERLDVLSISCHVIQKNLTHGTRHGTPMRQCMYYKAHDMLKNAQRKQYKSILERSTTEERSRNENSWTLSLNAEGAQGPLNQRSDVKDAKQTCKRLYHECTAITGSGNKPVLQSNNKSDKGLIDSL